MRRARTAARAPLAGPLALLVLGNIVVLVSTATTAPPDTLSALGAILPPFVSDNFEELVKTAAATCEALPLEVVFARTTSLDAPRAELVRYSQRGRSGRRAAGSASAADWLRRSEPLVLYVPGWWNTPTDASSRALVDALMSRHRTVYLLDTSRSFCRGYVAAVADIMPLAHVLYGLIKKIHKTGYPVSSIHFIGFSLGAHVAGLTGKLVRKNLNTTLGRITALDPARPCFARPEYRLDKRDAQFVQVIHSSPGVLGLEEPVGHADVYLNGVHGRHPECQHRPISLECDHAQAWKLYSASAVKEKMIMGRRCANWSELLQDECSGDETVLGYECSSEAHGMYLYKSKEKLQPQPRALRVFNLFNLLRWPFSFYENNGTQQ